METVNTISFVFLFLFIPLGMLLAGIYSHHSGAYIPSIFTKLMGATLIHLIVSAIEGIVIYEVNSAVVSEIRTGQEKIDAGTLGLLTLVAYFFVGWLLCSLVGGKFVRSISDFGFSKSK